MYKHSSGLIFETARMMNNTEKESYDITIVCMWMPNCASEPMIIIGWFFGEPDAAHVKEIADKFCADKTDAEIQNLIECQDLPDNPNVINL